MDVIIAVAEDLCVNRRREAGLGLYDDVLHRLITFQQAIRFMGTPRSYDNGKRSALGRRTYNNPVIRSSDALSLDQFQGV